jgi:hypothetical protein
LLVSITFRKTRCGGKVGKDVLLLLAVVVSGVVLAFLFMGFVLIPALALR